MSGMEFARYLRRKYWYRGGSAVFADVLMVDLLLSEIAVMEKHGITRDELELEKGYQLGEV